MRLIGLCGRSGSGKSVFAAEAAKKGVTVIDCDRVYSSLVDKPSPCLDEIAAVFGDEYVKNGALDREKTARAVFSDPAMLEELNGITHKHIISAIEDILSGLPEDAAVMLDAPTLFESGLYKRCDLIISVIAPYDDCIKRIVLRDGISENSARRRLENQKTNEFLIENSDCIIYNESDAEAFAASAAELAADISEGRI